MVCSIPLTPSREIEKREMDAREREREMVWERAREMDVEEKERNEGGERGVEEKERGMRCGRKRERNGCGLEETERD